jgi:hypothetical protein
MSLAADDAAMDDKAAGDDPADNDADDDSTDNDNGGDSNNGGGQTSNGPTRPTGKKRRRKKTLDRKTQWLVYNLYTHACLPQLMIAALVGYTTVHAQGHVCLGEPSPGGTKSDVSCDNSQMLQAYPFFSTASLATAGSLREQKREKERVEESFRCYGIDCRIPLLLLCYAC